MTLYYVLVIKSFKDSDTKQLFDGEPVKRWKHIEPVARRKLVMIDAAAKLDDLKAPPGNKLHKLDKDRAGQYGIRINDQYRVCFEWREAMHILWRLPIITRGHYD